MESKPAKSRLSAGEPPVPGSSTAPIAPAPRRCASYDTLVKQIKSQSPLRLKTDMTAAEMEQGKAIDRFEEHFANLCEMGCVREPPIGYRWALIWIDG
ncbi:hypothetical protein NLG97_g7763 [Lecanicillium saksenae]|uniref:Uncharacterized protein n=1 Tax=Lecanicillium saksenae TaxID=468837 RepID=A0ACC1QNU5_9HYPO|nr:hypothetical protein NLG97_g7763 [Lecanicillium saksenae]